MTRHHDRPDIAPGGPFAGAGLYPWRCAIWRNPKYAAPAETSAAPQEQGERLATFPRGEGAEMRVGLATFENRPYISLRVWERNDQGDWWPVRGKGCSIRMGEASELAKVLATIAGQRPDRPVDRQGSARRTEARPGVRSPDPGRQPRPAGEAREQALPLRSERPPWIEAIASDKAPDPSFDEFAE